MSAAPVHRPRITYTTEFLARRRIGFRVFLDGRQWGSGYRSCSSLADSAARSMMQRCKEKNPDAEIGGRTS